MGLDSLFSKPEAPALPPPPPPPNRDAAEQIRKDRERIQKKSSLLAGFQGTNRTGGLGLTQPAQTATKTLLGS